MQSYKKSLSYWTSFIFIVRGPARAPAIRINIDALLLFDKNMDSSNLDFTVPHRITMPCYDL